MTGEEALKALGEALAVAFDDPADITAFVKRSGLSVERVRLDAAIGKLMAARQAASLDVEGQIQGLMAKKAEVEEALKALGA